MEISDVQVKLIGNGDERLKASCTIAIDGDFVVRDVKIIEGTNGLFVAMPSRKLTDHCPKCRSKNHLRARYCNNCGAQLDENRWMQKGGTTQLHAEIAHPINRDCRERLHNRVIGAYEAELDQHNDESDSDVVIEDFSDTESHSDDQQESADATVHTPDTVHASDTAHAPDTVHAPDTAHVPDTTGAGATADTTDTARAAAPSADSGFGAGL